MTTTLIIALITSATVIAAAAKYAATKTAAWLKTETGLKYKPYVGYAVVAVKLAEQAISDNTENKGAAKADFAFKTFVSRYEEATGEKVTTKVDIAQVKALIEEVLDTVKANGTLTKPAQEVPNA